MSTKEQDFLLRTVSPLPDGQVGCGNAFVAEGRLWSATHVVHKEAVVIGFFDDYRTVAFREVEGTEDLSVSVESAEIPGLEIRRGGMEWGEMLTVMGNCAGPFQIICETVSRGESLVVPIKVKAIDCWFQRLFPGMSGSCAMDQEGRAVGVLTRAAPDGDYGVLVRLKQIDD